MVVFKISGRDQRQMICIISKLLRCSKMFYQVYDKVIFFPAKIIIPSISILPRQETEQQQYINFLNQQTKNILLVCCDRKSYERVKKLKQFDILVCQKKSQQIVQTQYVFIGPQNKKNAGKSIGKKAQIYQKFKKQLENLKRGQILLIKSGQIQHVQFI